MAAAAVVVVVVVVAAAAPVNTNIGTVVVATFVDGVAGRIGVVAAVAAAVVVMSVQAHNALNV